MRAEHAEATVAKGRCKAVLQGSHLVSDATMNGEVRFLREEGPYTDHPHAAVRRAHVNAAQIARQGIPLGLGPEVKVLTDAREGRTCVRRRTVAGSAYVHMAPLPRVDVNHVQPEAPLEHLAIELD